jgi:hypothetical protein
MFCERCRKQLKWHDTGTRLLLVTDDRGMRQCRVPKQNDDYGKLMGAFVAESHLLARNT